MFIRSHFIKFLTLFVLILISVQGRAAKQIATSFNCDALTRSSDQKRSELYVDDLERPCNNFWEYACGNWHAPAELDFAQPSDTLTTMKASNKYLLMKYFNELARGEKMNSTDLGLALFYRSCLDRKAFKSKAEAKQTIRVYTDILEQISSGWPILQNNLSLANGLNLFNWAYVAGEMRRYGAQALISTTIEPNWQNSKQLIFYVRPPSFKFLKTSQSDTTADPELEFLYQRYIKLLMMDLGIKVRKANVIAKEIVDFEKSLMNLLSNERLVVLKKPQTLSSLAAEVPDLNFVEFFKTLLKDFNLPPQYEDLMLIVADHDYLKGLSRLIKMSSSDIIAKYLMVQFLSHFQVHLQEEHSFIKQNEECLLQLNEFMPSELTRLFLRLRHGLEEEFLLEAQDHITIIFEKLKKQFEKLFNSTTVFERDLATKILSREKLRAMKLLLPTLEPANEEEITFQIGDNYDVNLINLSKLKALRQLNRTVPYMVKDASSVPSETKLSLTSLYGDQSYGPLDVNSYYRLRKNAIELPIGILQFPLYDKCSKPAKVYGGLAFILAHEIMHAFDYDGMNYDKFGNVTNAWGVKAIIKFGVKSNCYLNSRYTNGPVTINENIADSEGLRLALETFLDSEMGGSFDQDDLKMFFLSFAQVWCGGSSNKKNSLSLHATHSERVNNVLGNFMEFADVYKCRPGNKMHPEEKCRVW